MDVVKVQYTQLVPQQFLDDCIVNLLDYLNNPHLRPAPVPLTRRQKLARWVHGIRDSSAAWAYRRISGRHPSEDFRDY